MNPATIADSLGYAGRVMVAMAEGIAHSAHDGQVDKAGEPYIGHPTRIVANLHAELGWVVPIRTHGLTALRHVLAVGWLHDVVEDSEITLANLAEIFPTDVVEAVDAITHRPNEHNDAYLSRVAANPLARIVKIADIRDNLDSDRLVLLDDETAQRLRSKYHRALHRLGAPLSAHGVDRGWRVGR